MICHSVITVENPDTVDVVAVAEIDDNLVFIVHVGDHTRFQIAVQCPVSNVQVHRPTVRLLVHGYVLYAWC